MEKLTWIAANASFTELCVFKEIKEVDIEISQDTGAELADNTFSIAIDDEEWAANRAEIGGYIYAPGTEYGGQITYISHSTAEHSITLQGPTWRGLLFQRAIEPPAGEGYYEYSGDALALVRALVDGKFGGLYSVAAGTSGVTVSASYRYDSIATGLHATLREYGLRLAIAFDNVAAKVTVDVDTVDDLTDSIEVSQDYGVDFTSTEGNIEVANHCLALGIGELENRTVLNVYRVGTNYYTQRPASITEKNLRTVVLDYGSAENTDALKKSAIQKLESVAPAKQIRINQLALGEEVQLGDIISIRDRLTGLSTAAEAVGKILKVSNGQTAIEMRVNTVGAVVKDTMTWDDLKGMTWLQVKADNWSKYGG